PRAGPRAACGAPARGVGWCPASPSEAGSGRSMIRLAAHTVVRLRVVAGALALAAAAGLAGEAAAGPAPVVSSAGVVELRGTAASDVVTVRGERDRVVV